MSWLSDAWNWAGDAASSVVNAVTGGGGGGGGGGGASSPISINIASPSPSVSAASPSIQYQDTLRNALQAQIDLAPQLYQSESTYQPKYLDLQAQNQKFMLDKAMEMANQYYPQAQNIASQYEAGSRAAELSQLQSSLPKYQAAFSGLTPGYSSALESAGKLAQSAMLKASGAPLAFTDFLAKVQSNVGISPKTPDEYQASVPVGLKSSLPIFEIMANQATSELKKGKFLTPEELRLADQAARSAYAARGTALGSQSAAAEVLNRADVANQRYQQRLAAASTAGQQLLGVQAQSFQQAQANEQLKAQAQQQAFQQ